MYINVDDIASTLLWPPPQFQVVSREKAWGAWHVLMLRQTLEYAERNVPEYSRRFVRDSFHASDLNCAGDLRRLSLLNKRAVEKNLESFMSGEAAAEFCRCTSGTTGKRLIIYGNKNEQRAYGALICARQNSSSGERPLVLRIGPASRRTLSSIDDAPSSVMMSMVFSSDASGFWFDYTDHLIQMLSERYLIPSTTGRISILHLTPPFLFETVTSRIIDRGIDPGMFGIQDIVLTGGFVTTRVRELAATQWGARCHASYSCTEIIGEALECREDPRVFHAGITYFSEILDIETNREVECGSYGELVLTSYAPFQMVMPFIRYRMEDIVERLETSCECGAGRKSFRVVGRRIHCIDLRDVFGKPAFIGPADVCEAVANLACVPKIPYPRFRLSRTHSGEQTVLRLDLEVSDPRLPGALSDAVKMALVTHLRQLMPTGWQELPLHVKVILWSKGTLREPFVLYGDR